jgi:PAS domain S-box-containing protein
VGEGRTVETRVVPLLEGPERGRLLVIAADITERREAEKALRDREQRFRSIFDSIFGFIGLLEPNGTVLEANRASLEFMGLEPRDVVGKPFWECGWGATSPTVQAAVRDAVARAAAGDLVRYEVEVVGVGGRKIPLDFSITPMRDETGRIVHLVPEGRNIEGWRQMQEQLRQREKLAAIGQLAGGIAHDFNNQLSSIVGYAELLSRVVGQGQAGHYAAGILSAANRAAELTTQLLAFSRKGKYLSVPVDVHALIGDVVQILDRLIDKRIRITRALGADHPVTLGDPTQLQNMLLNLALNARDAMVQGGEMTFTTTIEAVAQPRQVGPHSIAPGRHICIRVSDTGRGMTDEVKGHLFEPFFTTKPVGAGTGMGLASVYGTVRNHHGAIDVQSEVGRGTTVRVWLPLAPDDAQEAKPEGSGTHPRGVGRVLLVDDEPLVLEAGDAVLRDLGYEVVTCRNGAEAIERYRAHWREIDVVILDMVMPVMAGREAFEAMRQVNPAVRAILSSGYSLNEEVQSILDAGVLGFVSKPYRQAELARAVAEALGSPPRWHRS